MRRRGRRGGLRRETLICENDTTRGQRASEAKRHCQHSTTRRLVGNRQLSPDLRHRGNRFPIGKVKATNLQTTRRERERDPRRSADAAGDCEGSRDDCGMGPTRLTSQWRASGQPAVSLDRFATSNLIYQRPRSPTFFFLLAIFLSPSASSHKSLRSPINHNNLPPGHLHNRIPIIYSARSRSRSLISRISSSRLVTPSISLYITHHQR